MRNNQKKGARRCGFSLIEVNVAIMLVAVGLMALFSLFPQGLSLGSDARSDTRQAVFAEMALSMVEANALNITNRMEWTLSDLVANSGLNYQGIARGYFYNISAKSSSVNGPSNIDIINSPDNFILYRLVFRGEGTTGENGVPGTSYPRYRVELYCSENLSGDSTSVLQAVPGYYTHISFRGI